MKYIVAVNAVGDDGDVKEGTEEEFRDNPNACQAFLKAVALAKSHGVLDHKRIRVELSVWKGDLQLGIINSEDVTR